VKDVTHFFGERLVSKEDSTVEVLTFMKAIHVQLAYKRRDICMFEVLSIKCKQIFVEGCFDIRKHFGEVVRRRHNEALRRI
jgi:hypothetical protein